MQYFSHLFYFFDILFNFNTLSGVNDIQNIYPQAKSENGSLSPFIL